VLEPVNDPELQLEPDAEAVIGGDIVGVNDGVSDDMLLIEGLITVNVGESDALPPVGVRAPDRVAYKVGLVVELAVKVLPAESLDVIVSLLEIQAVTVSNLTLGDDDTLEENVTVTHAVSDETTEDVLKEVCDAWLVLLRPTEKLTYILVGLKTAVSVAVIVEEAVVHGWPLWLEEAVALALWLSRIDIDSTADALAHSLLVPVSLPPSPPAAVLGVCAAVSEVKNERDALVVCEVVVVGCAVALICVLDVPPSSLPVVLTDELIDVVNVAIALNELDWLNVFIAVWLGKDDVVLQPVIDSVDITLAVLHPELLIVLLISGVCDKLSRDWDGNDDNVVVRVEVIEGDEEIVELEVEVCTLERLPLNTVPVILLLGLCVTEFVLIRVRVCIMLLQADTLSVEYADTEANITVGEKKLVRDTVMEVARLGVIVTLLLNIEVSEYILDNEKRPLIETEALFEGCEE
jgi:hypothetical protein